MVEAAYRHHGIDARYINCEVAPEDLGDAVRGARAMGWAGFNCSIPHKVAVIDHLDGLGESADGDRGGQLRRAARRAAGRREHRRAGLRRPLCARWSSRAGGRCDARRRRGRAGDRRRDGARGRGARSRSSTAIAAAAPSWWRCSNERTPAKAELVVRDGVQPSRRHRHRRQRDFGRAVSRRRRAARARPRRACGRDGGRRRDPQPAAHPPDP